MQYLNKNRSIKTFIIFFSFIILLSSCITIKTKKDIAIEYYNLANEYYNLEKFQNAIDLYKKSLEIDSNNKNTILNLIITQQKAKKYDEAQEVIFNNYVSTISDFNKNLLLLLGNNYFLQEKYQNAIDVFNNFIEAYPDQVEGYYNLGLIYNNLTQKEIAFENFYKAYEINETYVPALYHIGYYYYENENYEESLKFFNNLTNIEKKDDKIFYTLAELKYKIKEYKSAEEDLEQAIKINKENPDYYFLMAKIYASAYRKKEETIQYLEEALKNGFDKILTINKLDEFQILKENPSYKELIEKYIEN